MSTELQSQILRLAVESSLDHPGKGWSEVCSESGLRGKIMKAAGCETGSFTDCLEAVGLTRAAVVDAFVLARPAMQRTLRKMTGKEYVPVTVTGPVEPEKSSVPALKPVPCRTEVTEAPCSKSVPEKSVPGPRPEAARKPESIPVTEPKAVIARASKASTKAPAEVPSRKAAVPKTAVQGSLF